MLENDAYVAAAKKHLLALRSDVDIDDYIAM